MADGFDLVFRNGTIIDGTGGAARSGDVAIEGGTIAAVGEFETPEGVETVDVSGLIVAPGFIDIHAHSELLCLAAPGAESKVSAGVTSEFSGNCGGSPFPARDASAEDLAVRCESLDVTPDWNDAPSFFDTLGRAGSGVNRGFFVGHGAVRTTCMGRDSGRPPTADELFAMKSEVAEAMEAGCWGLSTGLIYPPGCFAETGEVIELARVAAGYGGIYTTHMRSEGAGVLDGIAEALRIGDEAGIGVQINHLKVTGTRNWPLFDEVKRRLFGAFAAGADMTADRYPYIAGHTWLASVLPSWSYEGGREKLVERLASKSMRKKMTGGEFAEKEPDFWSRVRISFVHADGLKDCEGKSIDEIASERGADPLETVFEVLIADEARTSAIFFSMDESQLEETYAWPFVMVASDAGALGLAGPSLNGSPHPRATGTSTRFLGHYVRDRAVVDLVEGVHMLTGMPAGRLGLTGRGVIETGNAADITVFDPDSVAGEADYDDPRKLSTGIAHVLVNGQFAVKDGALTGSRSGVVLLRGE